MSDLTINVTQLELNWNNLFIANPNQGYGGIDLIISATGNSLFWDFRAGETGKDLRAGHVNFTQGFTTAHVTLEKFKGEPKVNYWFQVNSAGRVENAAKVGKTSVVGGAKYLNQLPPNIKNQIIALLNAIYVGTL